MTIRNFKNYFIRNAAESGRTMVEVMAILAIVGVLSVGGVWLFGSSNQEKEINDIIYQMNLQVAQIYPAMERNGSFSSKSSLDKFLSPYTRQVGKYVLSFQADPNSEGDDFIMQITKANGEPIKGKMCRALVHKMAQLKMAKDVSFSLKDEEMDDGTIADLTVPLNGKTIDYSAMCGD